MCDSYYEMWCECGQSFYGDDRSRGRRCARCRAKATQRRDDHVDAVKYAIGADPGFVPTQATIAKYNVTTQAMELVQADEAKAEQHSREQATAPPTLREWLGDRVSELGRWADVLREHPVAAGDVTSWQWEMFGSEWHLEYQARSWRARLSRNSVRDAVTGACDPWELDADTLQMALFTRHPDVKPEPKRATFPWNPYPKVV